ncbi:hypothetical protein HK098_003175 [Nowakowskiella sp. JEL0407]|nr:hypothetical protein HK098_003175 [Nowakowskiella sp. JEL0407]
MSHFGNSKQVYQRTVSKYLKILNGSSSGGAVKSSVLVSLVEVYKGGRIRELKLFVSENDNILEELVFVADPLENSRKVSVLKRNLQIGFKTMQAMVVSREKTKFQLRFMNHNDLSEFETACSVFLIFKPDSVKSEVISLSQPTHFVEDRFSEPPIFKIPSERYPSNPTATIQSPAKVNSRPSSVHERRPISASSTSKRSRLTDFASQPTHDFHWSQSNDINPRTHVYDQDDDFAFHSQKRELFSQPTRAEFSLSQTHSSIPVMEPIYSGEIVERQSLTQTPTNMRNVSEVGDRETKRGSNMNRTDVTVGDLKYDELLAKPNKEFLEFVHQRLKSPNFRKLLKRMDESIGAKTISDLYKHAVPHHENFLSLSFFSIDADPTDCIHESKVKIKAANSSQLDHFPAASFILVRVFTESADEINLGAHSDFRFGDMLEAVKKLGPIAENMPDDTPGFPNVGFCYRNESVGGKVMNPTGNCSIYQVSQDSAEVTVDIVVVVAESMPRESLGGELFNEALNSILNSEILESNGAEWMICPKFNLFGQSFEKLLVRS